LGEEALESDESDESEDGGDGRCISDVAEDEEEDILTSAAIEGL